MGPEMPLVITGNHSLAYAGHEVAFRTDDLIQSYCHISPQQDPSDFPSKADWPILSATTIGARTP